MFACPRCNILLGKQKSPSLGLTWVCPSCHGRALTLELLRHAVPPALANQLWQRARSGKYAARRRCPACKRLMAEVPIIVTADKTVCLDVCTGCHFVWFDTREFETLPKLPPKAPAQETFSPEAKKALALAQLELAQEEYSPYQPMEGPDHWWEIGLALCGVPVEYNDTPLRRAPVATWTLAVLIAAVSLAAMTNLQAAVENWGLVPAAFGRHLGLTFLTSFFLHGGLFHLLSNLYFLVVFGDNTEDVLGKGRFLLLVAVAAFAGDLAHILTTLHSTIPCVGASGGISGVLAYYCLRFPTASVGFIWWLRWFRLPVGILFALWVVSQLFDGLFFPEESLGVAVFAHLGGAAVGVLFWGWTRRTVSVGARLPETS